MRVSWATQAVAFLFLAGSSRANHRASLLCDPDPLTYDADAMMPNLNDTSCGEFLDMLEALDSLPTCANNGSLLMALSSSCCVGAAEFSSPCIDPSAICANQSQFVAGGDVSDIAESGWTCSTFGTVLQINSTDGPLNCSSTTDDGDPLGLSVFMAATHCCADGVGACPAPDGLAGAGTSADSICGVAGQSCDSITGALGCGVTYGEAITAGVCSAGLQTDDGPLLPGTPVSSNPYCADMPCGAGPAGHASLVCSDPSAYTPNTTLTLPFINDTSCGEFLNMLEAVESLPTCANNGSLLMALSTSCCVGAADFSSPCIGPSAICGNESQFVPDGNLSQMGVSDWSCSTYSSVLQINSTDGPLNCSSTMGSSDPLGLSVFMAAAYCCADGVGACPAPDGLAGAGTSADSICGVAGQSCDSIMGSLGCGVTYGEAITAGVCVAGLQTDDGPLLPSTPVSSNPYCAGMACSSSVMASPTPSATASTSPLASSSSPALAIFDIVAEMSVELPYTISTFDEAAQTVFECSVADTVATSCHHVNVTNVTATAGKKHIVASLRKKAKQKAKKSKKSTKPKKPKKPKNVKKKKAKRAKKEVRKTGGIDVTFEVSLSTIGTANSTTATDLASSLETNLLQGMTNGSFVSSLNARIASSNVNLTALSQNQLVVTSPPTTTITITLPSPNPTPSSSVSPTPPSASPSPEAVGGNTSTISKFVWIGAAAGGGLFLTMCLGIMHKRCNNDGEGYTSMTGRSKDGNNTYNDFFATTPAPDQSQQKYSKMAADKAAIVRKYKNVRIEMSTMPAPGERTEQQAKEYRMLRKQASSLQRDIQDMEADAATGMAGYSI